MKKQWTRPMASIQEFIPNEYVAACEYIMYCDVKEGVGYYEGNNKLGYQKDSKDRYIDSGYGCFKEHRITVEGKPDYNSMWDPDNGDPFPTYYWKDRRGVNHFASKWEKTSNGQS